MPDLLQLVDIHPALTTLARLIHTAGLTSTLRGPVPLTLFAPADDAFANLAPSTLATLQQDNAQIETLLLAHLVAGALVAADLMSLPALATLDGQQRTVASTLGLSIDGAYLTEADILAENGVLHCIDRVLQVI